MADPEETSVIKAFGNWGPRALSRKERKDDANWNVTAIRKSPKQEPIDTLKNTYGHQYVTI
jgi:hypothetical protein